MVCTCAVTVRMGFQSTHPARGGTARVRARARHAKDFNPPTPRGVGQQPLKVNGIVLTFQSTHPARGGTRQLYAGCSGTKDFNPPTPRGVGLLTMIVNKYYMEFQSTHPARGGTWSGARLTAWEHFNPPTPRGVGPQGAHDAYYNGDISIHPPREGWDTKNRVDAKRYLRFQSTHPARGGTRYRLTF